MLKQRVITASILAVLVIWAVLKLPVAGFGAALLLMILPAAWEWARLAGFAAQPVRVATATTGAARPPRWRSGTWDGR